MNKRLRILVVDDEPAVRQSIKLVLEHDGHAVWLVDSGKAALEELARDKFDLLITDFSMPGMHGDQLVTRIRRLIPTQLIVMVSAFVEEYKIFGEASGRVDALLLKPFGIKELRKAIEQALRQEPPSHTSALPPMTKPVIAPDINLSLEP